MGFDKVHGQEIAIKTLQQALASSRLAHACLLAGPDGVGKAMAAVQLASALLCKEQTDDSCGHCPHCRKIERGLHPDLLTLQPQSPSKNVRIDQVREIQRVLSYKPYESANRVVLFTDAECATEEAANALLKGLEEPPPNTYFILTSSSPHRLLSTIRSRCQTVRFAPLHPEMASRIVSEAHPDKSAADIAVACSFAGGSVGMALKMLNSGLLDQRREVLEKITNLSPRHPSILFELSEWFAGTGTGGNRQTVQDQLALLASWLRDLLVIRAGLPDHQLIHHDLAPQLRQTAATVSEAHILKLQDKVREASNLIASVNANPKLAAESILALIADGNGQKSKVGKHGRNPR